MIVIKNISQSTKKYAGMDVESEAFYHPEQRDVLFLREDNNLIEDITKEDAVVGLSESEINEGQIDFAKQISYLFGHDVTQKDTDGALLARPKVTSSGWHYEPRTIQFQTCVEGSVHNHLHDGTPINDVSLLFLDADGELLIQGIDESLEDFNARLLANCVETHLDFYPTYNMDIFAGHVMCLEDLTTPVYIWTVVAPDIPAQFGGSKPFANGGFDLRFLKNLGSISYDGKSSKRLNYDSEYASNKIRFICKHALGNKITLQLIVEHFRE